jgi:hypothetical protein
MGIFFFEIVEMVAWKHDSFVDSDRQSSMPATEHDCAEDELTQRVPCPTKTVCLIREANRYPHCSIALEKQSVDRVFSHCDR